MSNNKNYEYGEPEVIRINIEDFVYCKYCAVERDTINLFDSKEYDACPYCGNKWTGKIEEKQGYSQKED